MDKYQLDAIMLNYILRNKKFLLELSKSIKANYFSDPFRDFYAVIHGNYLNPLIKEVLSLPALLDYCASNGLESKVDQFKKIYLGALQFKINGVEPADSDFQYYLKKFKDQYNTNVIKNTVEQMHVALEKKEAIPGLNKILENTIREVHSIHKGEVFDEGSLGSDINNIREEYKFISQNPTAFKGVLSGFPSLDVLTNGFFGSELILIAGFEGTGKSVLAMNIAVNAWLGSNKPGMIGDFVDDGKNIVYFSLEMPRSNRGENTSAAYLNKRVVSCIGGIPFSELRKGALSGDDEKTLVQTCEFVDKYDKIKKFYVIDIPRGATINDIEVKYLELREQFQVDMIVIDYIGLMEDADPDDDTDWKAQGRLAAGLHELARTYNIPVLSPVQVNRPSGANHSMNKQSYNTTRISRSKMISENANIIIQIGCRDQEEQYMDMPIYLIKMRDAPKGQLSFIKDFAKMRVLDNLSPNDGVLDLTDFENLGDT